jgi:CRP-like cAMP-binding protein
MEQQLSEVLPILNPAQLDAVMSEVEATEYQPGDTIIEYGEPATRFFIITEGAVELLSGSTDGTEQSAREVASGQTFGEMDLVRGGAYSFTARATHPSVVMAVDNETITNLSEKYHVEQGEIVQMLTRRYLETVLDGMLPKLRRRKRQIDMDLNFDVDTPPSPEKGSS